VGGEKQNRRRTKLLEKRRVQERAGGNFKIDVQSGGGGGGGGGGIQAIAMKKEAE